MIGRDGRLSGPELGAALAAGIRAAGANVIDVGMVATPMTYFAAHELGTQCSVMVTGSHNPPDYNGLKMVIAGDTLSGAEISALKARIEAGALATGAGGYRSADIAPAYLDRIARRCAARAAVDHRDRLRQRRRRRVRARAVPAARLHGDRALL